MCLPLRLLLAGSLTLRPATRTHHTMTPMIQRWPHHLWHTNGESRRRARRLCMYNRAMRHNVVCHVKSCDRRRGRGRRQQSGYGYIGTQKSPRVRLSLLLRQCRHDAGVPVRRHNFSMKPNGHRLLECWWGHNALKGGGGVAAAVNMVKGMCAPPHLRANNAHTHTNCHHTMSLAYPDNHTHIRAGMQSTITAHQTTKFSGDNRQSIIPPRRLDCCLQRGHSSPGGFPEAVGQSPIAEITDSEGEAVWVLPQKTVPAGCASASSDCAR